jgi:acetoin utilization deacetylase AcuC-like enzyme
MRVCYCGDYCIELPEKHPFPMGKFPALKDILLREKLVADADIVAVDEAHWSDLRRVHTDEYLEKLRCGGLTRREERRMGLPWSQALVRRSRLAVQGTLMASRMALEDGLAANLAGGTHHAFPDHGEGFCVLNDMAVSIRALAAEGLIDRALVIDLDVHQGNGTAAAFARDDTAYTFSMHGAKNYPFVKERSARDVELEDGMGDAEYLQLLARHLPQVLDAAAANIAFYLAGVDVVEGDRYGRLALSRAGLYQRDTMVLKQVKERGIPLVLLMSGGYAPTAAQTADLHAEAHRAAHAVYVAAADGSSHR